MLFYNRNFCFNQPKERKALINRLVRIFNSDERFEAYKPNENDEYYWTLDQGNDWKIQFDEHEPTVFNLRYRYNKYGRGFNNSEEDREYIVGLLLEFLISARPAPCHICKSTRYNPTDKKGFCSACGILP